MFQFCWLTIPLCSLFWVSWLSDPQSFSVKVFSSCKNLGFSSHYYIGCLEVPMKETKKKQKNKKHTAPFHFSLFLNKQNHIEKLALCKDYHIFWNLTIPWYSTRPDQSKWSNTNIWFQWGWRSPTSSECCCNRQAISRSPSTWLGF